MLFLILASFSNLASVDCKTISADLGGARLTLEVANTHTLRAQGLMGREYLNPNSGMLFIYPNPDYIRFWMKNTPLPLDMIFLGSDGRVSHIHELAVPFDRTPIEGGSDVQFVIEIEGGEAARLGLVAGQTLSSFKCVPPY